VAGGGMIGDWLKAQVTPGPVIVVQGILGQGFSERIDQGLDASLAGSGFHVVVREQGFFEREKATTIVESALQAHPDTRAIVAYSASMSNGIASYLKAKNLTGIAHVASDGDDEMFTWLGSPYLRACRYYSAAQTGVLAAKAVRGVLEGHPEPFRATVEQQMVTGDTAKAAIAANPYRYAQYATKARI
jgi:ABC-type sugar transport system substrate-binding protein